ncbi:MAG: 5-dehydro-4-deoxyglucarate dehydratase [Cyclobacteriaceae bacterium]|jgi:5-dehydro-4-deoxyglucarate dehydratase|nr:5-dehydro-4-deoxyglucarate dehydratase [Cyclobacteriaceae bacterium]
MKPTFEKIDSALRNGLLSFPVTDLDDQGQFNAKTFADRLEWFLSHEVSAVFVAGGTGEFFSLSKEEYIEIVNVTAQTIKGRTPTVSSIGRSIPEAIEYARIAEEAGIDALLLMPPYLTESPQSGVMEYAKTIIQSTKLPVIYYNRANGTLSAEYVLQLAGACPNLIALKDGTGNMQELNDTIKTVGDRLAYIGGVPTAEIISESYMAIGVNTYSSAVFNFVPKLANYFYKCLQEGNKEKVNLIIKEFFIPFVRLRNRKQGYAVSLIKAGAKLIGNSAGDVRYPLEMPTAEEVKELQKLIDKEEHLVN